MNSEPSRPKRQRVREPVQVYLDPDDQERLERLTDRLGTSKSDALRRGLEALERHINDPAEHPALRIAGIGLSRSHEVEARGSGRAEVDVGELDPAREHDQILADREAASWSRPDGE